MKNISEKTASKNRDGLFHTSPSLHKLKTTFIVMASEVEDVIVSMS